MKKSSMLAGAAALMFTGHAAASCSDETRLKISAGSDEISSHLAGKTVCGAGMGANAGNRWQEFHSTGGTLTEYARGPRDPVDPSHDVGSWSTSGVGNSSVVNYSYTGGDSYSFSVHRSGNMTYFCNGGAAVASAVVISGLGCGR